MTQPSNQDIPLVKGSVADDRLAIDWVKINPSFFGYSRHMAEARQKGFTLDEHSGIYAAATSLDKSGIELADEIAGQLGNAHVTGFLSESFGSATLILTDGRTLLHMDAGRPHAGSVKLLNNGVHKKDGSSPGLMDGLRKLLP